MSIPALPASGPIRQIAVLGSISILAWVIAAALSARKKRRQETGWSVALIVLAAATMIAGRIHGLVHEALQLLTVAVALRNVISMQGAVRWLTLVGVLAWLGSAIVAMLHFG